LPTPSSRVARCGIPPVATAKRSPRKKAGATQNIAERVRAREARRERLRSHAPKPAFAAALPVSGVRGGVEMAEAVATDEPTAD
jgi:hypothetical protein